MTEEELAGVMRAEADWPEESAAALARAILSSGFVREIEAKAAEQARLAAYAECAEIADANADAYEATLSQGLVDPGLSMKAAEARTLAVTFRQASGAAAHVSRSEFDRTDEALTITTVALRNILAEWGRDPVTNLVDWQRCVDRIHDRARKAIDEADALIRAAANQEKQG